MFTRIVPCICIMGALVFREPLSAQQPVHRRSPTRVPVTIALVNEVPHAGAPFVIQRRAGATPQDFILIRSDANQQQLTEAVHTLLAVRQAGGDTATNTSTMRMRPRDKRDGNSGNMRPLPWVGRVLADLRRAQPREILGIGTVPVIEIWLPPQRGRGALR